MSAAKESSEAAAHAAAGAARTVAQLAEYLGGRVLGDGSRRIDGAAAAEQAGGFQITFALDRRTLESAAAAGCVVIPPGLSPVGRTCIEVSEPKLAFVRILELLLPAERPEAGVDPQARVDPSARLAGGVRVEPFAVVEAEAEIGADSVIASGTIVGRRVRIGRDCRLYPRVVLYPGVRLGDRVILHAGVVIGSDGFGYVSDGAQARKFPQIGTVVIEDDVEIGANSTVDRAALGETRIGCGSKLDNLVQVGHNVRIGRSCLIAAQTGIGGSSIIGDGVVLGGQVGIADHTRIEDGAILGAKSGVPPHKVVPSRAVYWGIPARPLAEVKDQIATLALLTRQLKKKRNRSAGP